jgi:uncharacterized protein (DUF427 family)
MDNDNATRVTTTVVDGIPEYRISRLLDQGGMGGVYLAEDETLKRLVAIKVINPDLTENTEFKQRFMTEALIIAGFQHANIVTIFASGWLGPKQYFAMEYVSGGTLKQRLDSGRLPPLEAYRIAQQMADALAYSHHRSLTLHPSVDRGIGWRRCAGEFLSGAGAPAVLRQRLRSSGRFGPALPDVLPAHEHGGRAGIGGCCRPVPTPRALYTVKGRENMNSKPIRIPGPDHPITIKPTSGRLTVAVNGTLIADSGEALTLQEAAYAPVQYVPRKDVDMTQLQRTAHRTYCPYKGECVYYSIPAGGERSVNAVWSYEAPYDAVAAIREYLAFYPERVDGIKINGAG